MFPKFVCGLFGIGLGALTLLSSSFAETPDSLQLVQVQIIARHGSRAFMQSTRQSPKFSEWPMHCVPMETPYPFTYVVTAGETVLYDEYKKKFGNVEKFTESCLHEQLTIPGIHLMEKFGKLLRERYVEDLGFLNDQFDGESVWIRSSDTSRTILTAYHIMQGLYPKGKRKNYETTKIHVKPQSEENMYPRSTCTKFMYLKKLHSSLPELEKVKTEVKEILSKVEGDSSEIKFWTTRSVSTAANNLNTIIDHGLPLPQGLSYLDYKTLMRQSGKMFQGIYSTDEINRVGIGSFIKDIVGNIEIAVQPTGLSSTQPHPKLLLYAGHDNTLGPLLNALEVFDGHHPRMGSAMIFELWKNSQNKFFFNLKFYDPQEGVKDLKLPSCNTNPCPLNLLMDRTKQIIPHDYLIECIMESGNIISK